MKAILRRLVAILMVALGLLGLAACAAGVYAVWKIEDRMQRANDRTFALIDRGVGTVEDRVRRTQRRVEESRITTGEITRGLREWATREAKDRLVAQLEIETRTEKLAGQLNAADLWLEASTESVRDVQAALELSRTFGAGVDPTSLDEALETLATIRGRLQEAEQSVAELQGFATAVEEKSDENRAARALRILARVVVTITDIGPRLDRLAARVAQSRADLQDAKTRMSNYIRWAAIACTVILAWIAAGQLALCVWGRRCWQPTRSALK